jgi:small subunit ribosomal protein S20
MPITKSAIKRVKLSEKQRQRNSAYKAKLKTLIKKFEKSLISENKEVIQQYYQQCTSALDKAFQKGILAKNTVARKKSLLAKKLKINALSSKNQPPVDVENK